MAKTRREYPNPGPKPTTATPQELETWRLANEKFLMEGGQQLPAERAHVDVTDERIKAMRRDHVKFLERINPATDALWLALLRDGKDVLLDVASLENFDKAIGSSKVIDAPNVPAIVAIAMRQVAAAMRGDNAAASQIMERIEGKAGLRRGDVDPDDPVREKKTVAVVEATIRALTDKRIKEREDEAIDVGVKIVPTEQKESSK